MEMSTMRDIGHYASTEWGVVSPWGTHPTSDRQSADVTARNMRAAGHDAKIIWRGVTKWMADDSDEVIA